MDNNKIYIGDTLATLRTFPDEYFDITVTSPPYNKMGVAGGLVKEVEYKNVSDVWEENKYQLNQQDVLDELYRVTKKGGHVFYNHKVRWLNGEMIHPLLWIFGTKWAGRLRQEIVWDRGIAGNLRGWRFWQVEERIYWMQKGIVKGEELKSKHAKMTSIWRIRPENGVKDHPAPFPIAIPTRCIFSIADETKGLNILDPYCGSGTTLVTAACLGHNYVGIDSCAEYAALAERRIHDPMEILAVADETALHLVEQTYAERKAKKRK